MVSVCRTTSVWRGVSIGPLLNFNVPGLQGSRLQPHSPSLLILQNTGLCNYYCELIVQSLAWRIFIASDTHL
jgi:hypothetical protein